MSAYRDAAPPRKDTPDEAAARAVLGRYLVSGESFLWLGRPRRRGWSRLGLSLALIAVAGGLLLLARGYKPELPPEALLIVLPLFAPIVYLAVRRRIVEGPRQHLFYGLTDRRVIVFERGTHSSRAFRTFDLATLPGPILGPAHGGEHGTLYLDPRSVPERDPDTGLDRPVDPDAPPPLLDVPSYRSLADRIRAACTNAR